MKMHPFSSLAALALLALLAVSATGCSSIKKLTGQRNDTVLPGQREDILSPEQTRAQDPAITKKGEEQPADGADAAPCDPNVQDCSSGIDQEAGGAEG